MPQDRIKSSFRLASLALTGCLVAYAPSGFAFFGNMNPSDWFGGGRDYYDGPGRYGYGGYPGYGPGGPYGAPFGGYGVPYGGGYGAPYGGDMVPPTAEATGHRRTAGLTAYLPAAATARRPSAATVIPAHSARQRAEHRITTTAPRLRLEAPAMVPVATTGNARSRH